MGIGQICRVGEEKSQGIHQKDLGQEGGSKVSQLLKRRAAKSFPSRGEQQKKA